MPMSSKIQIAIPVVTFTSVTKRYFIEKERRIKKDLLNPFMNKHTNTFIAIDNVSFSISLGETIGLVGPNGSGKTTILRLIAGITHPSEGEIQVRGKIAPLIELGAGFHPEFSGRENIFLNGSILGMSMQEIESKFESIVDFSGNTVKQFLETPIKKYSLGMKARLGFSIAIHTDPDILLVDESLSVGDVHFRKKAIKKLKALKKEKKTIIIASHDLTFIEKFCSRTMVMEKGKLVLKNKHS